MNERLALAGKLLFVLTIGACAMFAPAMFGRGLDLTFTWLWTWGLWRGVAAVAILNLAESLLERRRTEAFRKRYSISKEDWRSWSKDEEGKDLEF